MVSTSKTLHYTTKVQKSFRQVQGFPRNITVGESFECFLPYAVLDIKDFLQFISFKNTFSKN